MRPGFPNRRKRARLLAQSYLRSLEVTPALEHYRIAHELEPKNLVYRQQMGLCAIAMGDYASALKFYEDAKSIAPTEHSEAMAALMLHRLGRFQEAIQAYGALLNKLKRDHVESPHVLRGMAMLLRDVGAPIAADRFLQEFTSVYRIDPARVSGMLMERDTSIDYHGWTRFAHKADLARALNESRGKPGAPRFPDTFVLPEDRQALIDYAAREQGALFIAKPQRGTGGQGMTITRDVDALADRDGFVVQRYVERPFLVDGRKGHVRLYGLVTCLNPFRGLSLSRRHRPLRARDLRLERSEPRQCPRACHQHRAASRPSPTRRQRGRGAGKCRRGLEPQRLSRAHEGAEGVDVEAIRTQLRALMLAGFLGVVARRGPVRGPSQGQPAPGVPVQAVRPRRADRRRGQALVDRGST